MIEDRVIPFVKPARVGNFKVWRSKKTMGAGRSRMDVEQINVSDLEGLWQVKIPATSTMFGLVRDLYADAEAHEKNEQYLLLFFSDMLYASCIANGYFHRGIKLLAEAYANPDILMEGKEGNEAFLENLAALRYGFLEWWEGYKSHVASNEPTEDEMRSDQVADEAFDALEGSNAED